MPPVGFELTIPTSDRQQIHVLDRAATVIGAVTLLRWNCRTNGLSVVKHRVKLNFALFFINSLSRNFVRTLYF